MHPNQFVLEERPIPQPGPGQVLARTLACGICGSDLHLYRHAEAMLELGRQAGVPEDILDKGVVLGHEFIAEIAGFGPDTRKQLAIGDRVTSIPFVKGELETVPMGSTPWVDGAYAEYFLLSEESLIPVPKDLPTAAAALTEPLAIGIHAVNTANLAGSPVAIVMGCGPIGLAVIAALRLRGIEHIIAGDLSAKRRELALAMGATTVVDAAQVSPLGQIPAHLAVNRAVAFECTGVTGMIGRIVEQIPARSEIVVAGIAHGSDSFTPMQAIAKELSIHFVSFYRQAEFQAALDALANGGINWQPWITGKVGLEGVAAAFEELKDPERHAKILIYPNGE
jgi:threonine dehydrogenase-like Zn-dependent dehydrogenase